MSLNTPHVEILSILCIQVVLCIGDRDNIKFLSLQNKNKSATRGAQLVPIGIPTMSLYKKDAKICKKDMSRSLVFHNLILKFSTFDKFSKQM